MTNSGKILVLGPTGNVGSVLIPRLTAMGADFRALVRDEPSETSKVQALKDAGVELFYGDLNNLDTLHEAFKGVAKVFLLTTPGPNGGAMASNAIAAAKQSGNPHVVNLSVAKARSDHPSRFGREHGETDTELMESGLPYTFVRAIYFMQNTLPAAQTVASQGTIFMPMKNGKVGMIDARDVAEAVAMVLTSDGHEGKSYLLTGPDSISIQDVANTLSKVLGKEVRYVDVPPAAAKDAMLGMGMPEWIADGIIELAGALSEGLGDYTTDDLEKLTGHRAGSYEAFARDFAQVFGGVDQRARSTSAT